MTKFNGHRCWNAWSVSLWINNDPGLYYLACESVKSTRNLDKAATAMMHDLRGQSTPDGARYSWTTVREALQGYSYIRGL